jgi:hypothetical protein
MKLLELLAIETMSANELARGRNGAERVAAVYRALCGSS